MMRKKCFSILALSGAVLTGAAVAQQIAQRTIQATPAVAAVLSNPLSQSKITDCADTTQPVPWNGNVTLHYSQQGLEVQGRDLQGHKWSTLVPASNILKCEVWAAKLRSGLPEDLLFLTADEMGEYASELTILFFDKSGRPHPWQAKGAFTSTSAGIQQFGLDKATANARLVVPIREGDKFDGYAYVQSLYKISPEGVTKVVTADGTQSWPSVSGNVKALVGTENKITESDTFNSAATPQVTWTLKLASVLSGKEDEPLIYSDGTKTRFPLIAVLEKTDGSRQIYFDGNTPDAINEIYKGNYAVQLKGSTCEEEECRPFILTAKQQ